MRWETIELLQKCNNTLEFLTHFFVVVGYSCFLLSYLKKLNLLIFFLLSIIVPTIGTNRCELFVDFWRRKKINIKCENVIRRCSEWHQYPFILYLDSRSTFFLLPSEETNSNLFFCVVIFDSCVASIPFHVSDNNICQLH